MDEVSHAALWALEAKPRGPDARPEGLARRRCFWPDMPTAVAERSAPTTETITGVSSKPKEPEKDRSVYSSGESAFDGRGYLVMASVKRVNELR